MLVKIISTILQNTYTTDDLVERIGLMRLYYNTSLFLQKEKTSSLEDVLQNECDAYTLEALHEWISVFEKEQIKPLMVFEALDTVQEDLGGVPSVLLYVPVRFTNEQIELFGTWFRENIQPNILLSLHIDSRATGGCNFVWKHMYYDFSLKYFMRRKKGEVSAIFDTYTYAK